MKLRITLAAVALSAAVSFGQNAKVVSAYNYLENYKRDRQGEPEALGKAKESIEPATTDESTMGKPKTWYYRGNIYFEIGQSKNPSHAGLSPDPYYDAAFSYQKCLLLDPKYEFANIAKMQLRFCSAQVLNKGVADFSAKDFAGALVQFEKCIKLAEDGKTFDTLAVRNALLASKNGKNYDKAIFYINKLSAAGIGGAQNYLDLSRIYAEKGDTTTAIKTLQEGRTKYPADVNLIIDELNYYLIKNDNVGAEKNLRDAIAADPKNPTLYFAAGTVYSNLKNYDKAEENFKKAIELKADYGDALFNLGVVYVNRGNEFLDKSNGFVDKRMFKEADVEKDKGMAQYKLAIEMIEKARLSNPKEPIYIKALKDLYGKVEDTPKYEEMKKLLDDMKN
jgi:tetratricopeptide (TPR) repeat protein